jgi:hypothetical protein
VRAQIQQVQVSSRAQRACCALLELLAAALHADRGCCARRGHSMQEHTASLGTWPPWTRDLEVPLR